MNDQQFLHDLLSKVSPNTQRVLVDWMMSPDTFADFLKKCPEQVAYWTFAELDLCCALAWNDGIPYLVRLEK